MPIEPASVQATRTLLEGAFTAANLVAAGWLLGLASRLPKRLDARFANESTSFAALGWNERGIPPEAGREWSTWRWIAIGFLIAACPLIFLTPYASLFPVMLAGLMSGSCFKHCLHTVSEAERLHGAGLAAQETIARISGRAGGFGAIILIQYGGPTPVASTLVVLAAAIQLISVGRIYGSTMHLGLALLLASGGGALLWSDWPSRVGDQPPIGPIATHSAAALFLVAIGIEFLILRRAPEHPAPIHPDLRAAPLPPARI